MKHLLAVLMLIIGLNSFADDINLWKKSTLNAILQRGELRVGLEPGYLPFEMKDKKGRIIGFDVDIAKEMAKAMGVKLTIVPTAFDGIIAGLITDKFDIIIAGMTITQSRNLKVNFSKPYMSVGQSIIAKKEFEGKSYKSLDKEGNVIVAKLGQTGEFAARKMFKKATIKTFDTETEAVQEVMNGRATAFVNDKPYNAIFMIKKGQTGNIVHLDEDLTYEPLGIALRKGDPDFLNWIDNFLTQMRGDGMYEKIYDKWFKSDSWLKKVE